MSYWEYNGETIRCECGRSYTQADGQCDCKIFDLPPVNNYPDPDPNPELDETLKSFDLDYSQMDSLNK